MDRSLFITSQLAGLVCAILATLSFSLAPPMSTFFMGGFLFAIFTIGTSIIMCMVAWKLEAYDLADEDRDQLRKRVQYLASKLSELAGDVHKTRQPSNETLRTIRHQLLALVLDELRQGQVPARCVTEKIGPEAIRDVVEAQFKGGLINLNEGRRWQRELVQYALEDKKSTGEPVSSK